MAKIEISDMASGYNLQKINDNFQTIADAINNGVLWRSNPIGEPNQMVLTNLDMNNNTIVNAVIILPTSPSGLPTGALWNDNGVVKIV